MSLAVDPVERLRQIWTPGREAETISAGTEPATEIDSLLRHCLHAILEQCVQGTIEINFNTPNTGRLRLEKVQRELAPGVPGETFIQLWVEPER